jgi:hypothetical protein
MDDLNVYEKLAARDPQMAEYVRAAEAIREQLRAIRESWQKSFEGEMTPEKQDLQDFHDFLMWRIDLAQQEVHWYWHEVGAPVD